jgi:hypothetical protein
MYQKASKLQKKFEIFYNLQLHIFMQKKSF